MTALERNREELEKVEEMERKEKEENGLVEQELRKVVGRRESVRRYGLYLRCTIECDDYGNNSKSNYYVLIQNA